MRPGRLGTVTALLSLLATTAAAEVVPLGAEFRVNTQTLGSQSNLQVAVQPNGDFVVAWDSTSGDGNGAGVFGQRFDASGDTDGPEFQINTYTSDDQHIPRIAPPGGAGLSVGDINPSIRRCSPPPAPRYAPENRIYGWERGS
jgi:hypothetical protein